MTEEYIEYPEESRNTYKTITISLVVIILLVLGYFALSYGYQKVYDDAYSAGAKDGQIYIANLQTENSILFYINETNTVDMIELSKLCGRQTNG